MSRLLRWGMTALAVGITIAGCSAPAPTVQVDELEPVTPWAALKPDDPTSAQLALVGLECFSNGPGVIPLVRCHSRSPDRQVSVDYQRSIDGTFTDGEITVPPGQQRQFVQIMDLIVGQLDPAAGAAAVAAALGTPAVTTIPSGWGTIRVTVAADGSGSATLTKAGITRTAIPVTPWTGSANDTVRALVAVGYSCTRTDVIRCAGLGESTVDIAIVEGAVDSVTLSPPAAFRIGTSPYTAAAYWLGTLAGSPSGRRLAGAVGNYVDDGEQHSVPIEGYRVIVSPGAVELRTDGWS